MLTGEKDGNWLPLARLSAGHNSLLQNALFHRVRCAPPGPERAPHLSFVHSWLAILFFKINSKNG